MSVGRRRHQLSQEGLVVVMGLVGILLLLVQLVLHELQKLVLRNVCEVSPVARQTSAREPLEHFLEGVLAALLVSHVVAECGLFVELCE